MPIALCAISRTRRRGEPLTVAAVPTGETHPRIGNSFLVADRGGFDPRDVFMRDLDLPRGLERELVHDRDRDHALNGSESRTLSTVGAFRAVSERDLRDPRDDASTSGTWKTKDSSTEWR